MSGFHGNTPFQFNLSTLSSTSSTNTITTSTASSMSTAGLFTNSSFPPPYTSKPSMEFGNSSSANFGTQNLSNSFTSSAPSYNRNTSFPVFPVQQSSENLNPCTSTTNAMRTPLFPAYQMPRPAAPSSSWPVEQRPFSFTPVSSVSQAVSPPRHCVFPNQIGFGMGASSSSIMSAPSFASVAVQPNVNQSQLSDKTNNNNRNASQFSFNLDPRFRSSAPKNQTSFRISGAFNQGINPLFSTSSSNNIFGKFTNSESKQQPNIFSENLWNQSAKAPAVITESKQIIETSAPKIEQTKEPSVETSFMETFKRDSEKQLSPKQQTTKPSGRISRRSPGLFTKALAGLKSIPHKASSSIQAAKTVVERSRDSKQRRSSVKSNDGMTASPVEIATFTSIICKGIPDDLNAKQTMLQHFGRYGIVRKILCNIQKQMATITFSTHEAALAAKMSGKVIRPDREPLTIFWARSPSSRSRIDSDSSRRSKTPDKDITSRSIRSRISKKYDDDVNKELESMSSHVKTLAPPRLLERPKERARSPKHQSATMDSPNLRSFQETPARTSHDRYLVLDNIDKTLRLGMKKQSNLATAKAVIGTCPDMCPEKERYMREDRGQLHSYEYAKRDSSEDIICDHRKAIKEYSRASADQEEPLPHELRPPKVLAMTMDYLVCNIMDLHENSSDSQGSAVEWYDFVWNRTRSIRKDIIQQHLCDHMTVDVVEKCARFHIHCSARLCEEDMMTFDQKYNNENLTNCLQTLKHMYTDLRAKGQPCRCESEIVTYDILLNLNEGDIVRQINVLHPDVQRASEIQLSVECANAISANNYVRFFKLVRRASYLRACILQRYFTQVRLKGFQGFVKAYCPNPNFTVQFPLSKLVALFGFEDHAEATEFVSFHNLVVESDYVMLDRSRFSSPENTIPLRRAKFLIESKRTCSVGELVNGSPLPANPATFYEPQNSFDEAGYLIREALIQYDIGRLVPEQKQVLSSPRMATDASDLSEEIFNKVTEEIANELVGSTTYGMIEKTTSSDLKFHIDFFKCSAEMAAVCLKEVAMAMILDVAKDGFKSSRAEELRNRMQKEAEELAKRKLIEKQKEECSQDLLDSLVRIVVAQEIVKMSNQEISNEYDVCKKRCIETSSQQVMLKLCQQWMEEFAYELCDDMYSKTFEHRRTTLSRVAGKLALWKAAEFFRVWQLRVLKRKRLRSSMELFPSSVLCSSLHTSNKNSLFPRINLTSPLQSVEDCNRISRLTDMEVLSKDLQTTIRHTCIDLFHITRNYVNYGKNMTNEWRRHQHIYWKLLLASSSIEERPNQFLSSWLQSKFIQPGSRNNPYDSLDEILSSVCCNNVICPSCVTSVKIVQTTCWKKEGRRSQLMGTQGIIYVLEMPENCNLFTVEAVCNKGRRSLASLFLEKPPNPSVPVLILVVANNDLSNFDLCHRLELDSLMRQGLISDYQEVQVDSQISEPNSTKTLTDGLKWLANNCPQPPSLQIDDVNHYLNKMVVDYFLPFRFHFTADYIPDLKIPNALIKAFNDVIQHAADCVSDSSLYSFSWPAVEFAGNYSDLPQNGWNNYDNLMNLKRLLLSFVLPQFKTDITACKDWSSLCSSLWYYISKLHDAEWSDRTFICAKLNRILEKSHQRMQSCESSAKPWQLLPWGEIISIFVDYYLTIAPTSTEVVYDENMYRSFTKSKDWDVIAVNESVEALPVISTVKRKSVEKQLTANKRRIFSDSDNKTDAVMSDLRRSCMELKRQLEIEKGRSAEYEKYLEKALNG